MTTSQPITLLTFTWQDIERDMVELGKQVAASGFAPDMLLGITRGGLVPLGLMARELDNRNIASITAQSYAGTDRGELSITNAPGIGLAGKKVLLVDELADSGITLDKVKSFIQEKYQPLEVRTAVGYVKKGVCEIYPDFFVAEIPDDKNYWIYFPWEEEPDIAG